MTKLSALLFELSKVDGVTSVLVAAYAFGALGWLALVYGSLPFVAHRRALMCHQGTA